MIRPGIRRLFRLPLRRQDLIDADVDEELRLHLALRAEQLERQGLSPAQAVEEAQRRFGTIERARRQLHRSAHTRERRRHLRDGLDALLLDIRHAARGLWRDRLFSAFSLASLAAGIGANAAMYGVVDRLLLRGPEHVVAPGRLGRVFASVTRAGLGERTTGTFGYVMFDHLERGARQFDGFAAYAVEDRQLGRGREARTVRAAYATAGFFPLVGVSAAQGRFFSEAEDRTEAADPVVVVSDGLWRAQFGADPAILGKSVRVNDGVYTVIGVAPRGFTGVELSRVDLWMPMSLLGPTVIEDWTRGWNAQWLHIVGRLRTGVSRSRAGDDLTAAHRASYDGTSPVMASARLRIVPLRYTDAGTEPAEGSVARWLLGVTVAVLLIACANVANLLVARTIRRRREIAVRLALGVSRARLVRFFVIESLLIALAGGGAALLVAGLITVPVRSTLLSNVDWSAPVVSVRVFLFALATATLTGLLLAIAPAAQAARRALTGSLKTGAGDGGGRRGQVRIWPTVAQAALSASLLIGAGLFVSSLLRAQHLPLGFDANRVLAVSPRFLRMPPGATAEEATTIRAQRAEEMRGAMERVRALPGVEGAALAVGSPFGNSFTVDLFVPGWDSVPALPGGGPFVSAVSEGYFGTVGTRLLRGRVFTREDRAGSEPVTIVNATMAATLWPGGDALGKCLLVALPTSPCARVVGVVEDAHREGLREPPAMQYYIPLGQERGFGGLVLLARAARHPESLASAVERTVMSAGGLVQAVESAPLQERIEELVRPWRLGTMIFGLSGLLALVVASVGLYSVLSYLVAQRTHEIGVRIALGAGGRHITGLVLRHGVGAAALGVLVGVAAAVIAGRYLQPLLFDTSPSDPLVLASTAVGLVGTAVVAALIPAARARRVDPMRALSAE